MMNGTMMQYFEWDLPGDGTLWNTLSKEAMRLAEAGVTALWLPPAYKDANGKNGVGYAVYDLYDLGEFEQKDSIPTKYGTKEEYLAAIEACHNVGIEVYADIVLNHKIGADETENIHVTACSNANRNAADSPLQQITAWTKFTFPGRKGKYSDFTWHARHFDGIDWDESKKENHIYLIGGKNWDGEVDSENGNYDYLMGADLDLDHSEVIKHLDEWGKWYLSTTSVDGFRLDAVKHMQATFYKNWLTSMRNYGKRNYFAVGEYWNGDLSKLEHYLYEAGDTLSLFDVPLHYKFYNASINPDGFDLRTIFDHTLVSAKPIQAVTFVDNHDTQPGQALCSFVETWFKPIAYALILLREAGYPCVFYGDYYGMPEHGISPVGKVLTNLLSVRQSHAYGLQHDYFDQKQCIGFTREGMDAENGSDGLACLISTGGKQTKNMFVGIHHANRKFFDATCGQKGIVAIDKNGFGVFTVSERSVSVWIPI